MKLVNYQIDALVAQARKQYEKENKQPPISKDRKEELKKEAKRVCEIANQIPKEILQAMYCDKFTEKTVLSKLISIEYDKHEIPEFNKQDFRERLIVASIECETLSQLKDVMGMK